MLSYRHPFGSNPNEPLHEPTYVKQHKPTKQTIKNKITKKIFCDLLNISKTMEIRQQESHKYRAEQEWESQAHIIKEQEYWELKNQEDQDYWKHKMQEDWDYHCEGMQDLDSHLSEHMEY